MDAIKFEQASKLHNELWEQSEDSHDGYRIFDGYLGPIGIKLGIPVGSFRIVKDMLESLGLIKTMRRGNRRQSTILRIYAAEALGQEGEIVPEHLTPARLAAKLASEVEALRAWREQLGEVNIVEAFREIDIRLTKVERELNAKKKTEVEERAR